MCAQWGISTVNAVRAARGVEEIKTEIDGDAVVIDVIAGDESEGVDYAVYQEYGWSEGRPQPFMGPARDKALEELPEIVGESKVIAATTDVPLTEIIANRMAERIKEHAKEQVPTDTGALKATIRTERRE